MRGSCVRHSGSQWAEAAPLITKLESHVSLSNEEKLRLFEALAPPRIVTAHTEILTQGKKSAVLTVLLSGFACRSKVLRDGRRQITAYLVPGDICDFRFLSGDEHDGSVTTMSSAAIAAIAIEDFVALAEHYPAITRAFLRAAAVDEAITREWLISLGQRTAVQRMAHLFCEFFVRLNTVNLTRGTGYDLPLTQAEMGAALGLSTVHVNRTLQELRRRHLISLKGKFVELKDIDRLADTAMFDPLYLGHDPKDWLRQHASLH